MRPRAYAHRLVECFLDRALDRWRGCRADAEGRIALHAAARDAEDARNVPERTQVDRADAQPRRSHAGANEALERRVAAPVETRPRQLRLPRDHECIALEHFEERGERRPFCARVACEAAARRAADAWLARRRDEMDELRREQRRPAVGKRAALDPGQPRVAREANVREAAATVLLVAEEREAMRVDRARSELARGRDDQPLLVEIARRVALDRLADRRGMGLRRGASGAAARMRRLDAEQGACVRALAPHRRKADVLGPGEHLLNAPHDADVRGHERLEALTRQRRALRPTERKPRAGPSVSTPGNAARGRRSAGCSAPQARARLR